MPRQNTSPASFPQAVLQQIEQLAQNIAIARKRRGETQAQWAKKLGVSQPTFARIERGDPGVAMASYVMCMWLIDPEAGLADLISPLNDHAALEREVAKIRKVRNTAAPSNTRKRGATSTVDLQKPGTTEANAAHTVGHPDAVHMASDSSVQPWKGVLQVKGKSNSTAEGLAALLEARASKP